MKIHRFRDSSGAPVYAREHGDGHYTRLEGGWLNWRDSGETYIPGKRLAPLDPVAIYCIGLNYADHAAESGSPIPGHPVLFMKSPLAVQHPGDPVVLPRHLRSDKVDYEVELALVIGRDCKNATAANALDYVAGYMCANDISARDWQSEWGGGQFCRGKSFDTFCPLGPCLVTPDEIPDPQNLRLTTHLNGECMQNGSTARMIFPVVDLIVFLSGSTTLPAGSVVLTGTPPGVGAARKPPVFLKPGDHLRVEVEGCGVLENPVVEEDCG